MTEGVAHLRALAAEPRPTGSEAAARARRYCASVLKTKGYTVMERPFEYSALAGLYGTPLGGLFALLAIGGGAMAGARANPEISLLVLIGGALVLLGAGRWLARRGVLVLPLMRRRGVNLEATRGDGTPTLWLVAHVDSKSQPVPLVARAAGIVVLACAWIASIVMAAIQLLASRPVEWRWIVIAGVIGALPVLTSTVGKRSAGAVDNASGVATVLRVAELLPLKTAIGVLISDAEELGLAGARVWCGERQPASAINVDGVDDAGLLTLMWTRPREGARRLENVVRVAANADAAALRLIRLIPGVLVDAVAFADAGWQVVTISRGDLGTLRRIHTARDNASMLEGEGVEIVARVLVRATTSLTERA